MSVVVCEIMSVYVVGVSVDGRIVWYSMGGWSLWMFPARQGFMQPRLDGLLFQTHQVLGLLAWQRMADGK